MQKSEVVTDEMQAARWNEMAEEFGRNMDGERKQRRMTDLLCVLREAGFTPKGATVLDIGCGPGALSIPLARAGATVVSFDIASGMLDRLKETAKAEKLDITTMEGSWYTADIDKLKFRKKFDLVIASMTPAVRDFETFERMMACSKGYCYYSNFIRRDMGGKAHQDLHTILGEMTGGHSHGPKDHDHGPAGHEHGPGPGLVYPFMYLYTLGYQPILELNHAKRSREQDEKEAADHTIEMVERKRKMSADEKKKVRDHFMSVSKDGIYKTESETYSGMMVWNIRK
ncbi:MAG: class I SAM-dependent methyltransferase [Methanomicrobiales archaeon]|nr:class I SAM-dependent methyltransferase [Methanomicrobiales archaeon]